MRINWQLVTARCGDVVVYFNWGHSAFTCILAGTCYLGGIRNLAFTRDLISDGYLTGIGVFTVHKNCFMFFTQLRNFMFFENTWNF